jgi:small-conductance mechanosensitive channel
MAIFKRSISVTSSPPNVNHLKRPCLLFVFWGLTASALFIAALTASDMLESTSGAVRAIGRAAGHELSSGLPVAAMAGWVAAIIAAASCMTLISHWALARRKRPPIEASMLGNIYLLMAALAVGLVLVYGFGQLSAFGTFFAMFGGMLLGWSLQAPVSGFAAWLLVSLKRPFRPGDRIQFPNLGLVGDVKEIGAMYTVLDQVGGSVGSEEAVGRFILVPNAMLFSQVVINYTVMQEAAYMLDEVVVRITYDSDWEVAEKTLLGAAESLTREIIEATGMKPYIRSDPYDYGVYMRLRYQARVKDRAEIAYKIYKKIFQDIQQTPSVDLAIPFIYSYRSGLEKRDGTAAEGRASRDVADVSIQEIPTGMIRADREVFDTQDLEQLARSIEAQGLLQPIVVVRNPVTGQFDVMAGQLRFAACKKLGWKTVPAIVRESTAPEKAMSSITAPTHK